MKSNISLGVKLGSILLLALILTSCYSVRLKTVQGVPEPNPMSERTDYYRDMKVTVKDTVINMGAVEKDFTMLIKDCEDNGFHTIEYRTTLGDLLINGITFGRKRPVHVKYVCMKPSN